MKHQEVYHFDIMLSTYDVRICTIEYVKRYIQLDIIW